MANRREFDIAQVENSSDDDTDGGRVMTARACRAKYRRYPAWVKSEIARTGNPNLFPDLNVPRTTALYWIKSAFESRVEAASHRTKLIGNADAENLRRRVVDLEQKLKSEKALRSLIERVRKEFPYDFRTRHVRDKNKKKLILDAVDEAAKIVRLPQCLKALCLSRSTHRRWTLEIRGCPLTKRRCHLRHINELTVLESRTMKYLVTSKKYAHLSINSLHLLAKRNSLLNCSVHTWYKYIRLNRWSRPNTSSVAKVPWKGIRASAPNELWHIDVSYIQLRGGKTIFLQCVIDNFSRYVVAWRVTTNISALNTVDCLKKAKEWAIQMGRETKASVLMDNGSENSAGEVRRFLPSQGMRALFAQTDIGSSNSMIEALFRTIKQRYLNYQNLRTLDDVKRKLRFFIQQYNEVIPHHAFKGATPKEMFLGTWTVDSERKIGEANRAASVARRRLNKNGSCSIECVSRGGIGEGVAYV